MQGFTVRRARALAAAAVTAIAFTGAASGVAQATPVCTDGFMGGPPAASCAGRIFPEAAVARSYVQYTADQLGFKEYEHGIQYLAQKYPRFVQVFKLSDKYGPTAVSVGDDKIRAGATGDTNDGRAIWVIKLTDSQVPDKGKDTLFYSLSVHGNERGGLEGGLRTAEDLAIAATQEAAKIPDGVDNYDSDTGRKPEFHEYEVKDILERQVVYFTSFNPDGWAAGDITTIPTGPYNRANDGGIDLNRQMPTTGSINASRNPLEENETKFGVDLMKEVAKAGQGGLMSYAADVHGELTSRAYIDIMYPAGEFDSVDHRRLMAIAERTKSVLDATLYEGVIDQAEEQNGGNNGGEDQNAVPTKPAHWATVWDTLGYTDTGFIGDYMATDVASTGMDYEIFLNHTVPDKTWNVYLQENHINGTRGIVKTAMAYALFQKTEFNDQNVVIPTKGRAGFVANPDTVTDADEDGPGPGFSTEGANGSKIVQKPYSVTNQQWFRDTNRLMPEPFAELAAGDVAADGKTLDQVDSLVLADVAVPADTKGRSVDATAYFANLKAWVERGGNLVLTDKALHALEKMGVVESGAVKDITVYQPYANFKDFTHPLAKGLKTNARQLVEAPALGYGIGNDASPMSIVDRAAVEKAKGKVVATTGNNSGSSDNTAQISVGEIALGSGLIRFVGGALPTPTEANDHRFGLRNYAMTYTGLFLMENAIQHDVPGLGIKPPVAPGAGGGTPVVKPASCLKGKTFTLKLSKKYKSAKIKLNGKKLKVKKAKKGGQLSVKVTLKRFKSKKLTFKVTGKLKGGRKAKAVTKRYRVC